MLNADLARERQDYADRQEHMVAEDNGNPPQPIAPSTPEEQAEISRLILSGEIYRGRTFFDRGSDDDCD